MPKALIAGSFDILHPGHIFLISQAKKYGDVHAIIARDETIEWIKGRKPFNSLHARMKNMEAFGVTPHEGHSTDRLKVIQEVNPDHIILGYDQRKFVADLETFIEEKKKLWKITRSGDFKSELFSSSKIRGVLEDPSAGFLLIDKPTGEPSFQTVAALRRITGIRQIGFAGTLDPMASGLLVCGISQATVLLDWLHFFQKTYEAEAHLGKTSDTYDSEGVVSDGSSNKPSQAEVVRVLQSFIGETLQTPPMYSAKKIAGKKLYELARKGEVVAREPRKIAIDSIELLSYEYPTVKFWVQCSSGTYVRSLIHDIGQTLGVGALMSGLRRKAIGPFGVEGGIGVSSISHDSWKDKLVSAEDLRRAMNELFCGRFNVPA